LHQGKMKGQPGLRAKEYGLFVLCGQHSLFASRTCGTTNQKVSLRSTA
jgi:hypothetical protein